MNPEGKGLRAGDCQLKPGQWEEILELAMVEGIDLAGKVIKEEQCSGGFTLPHALVQAAAVLLQ